MLHFLSISYVVTQCSSWLPKLTAGKGAINRQFTNKVVAPCRNTKSRTLLWSSAVPFCYYVPLVSGNRRSSSRRCDRFQLPFSTKQMARAGPLANDALLSADFKILLNSLRIPKASAVRYIFCSCLALLKFILLFLYDYVLTFD